MFNLSSLTLSRCLSAGAVFASTLTLVPSAYGFNQVDVDTFRDEGSCNLCDISGADLSGEGFLFQNYFQVNATGTNFRFTDWLAVSNPGEIIESDFTGADFTFSFWEPLGAFSSIFVDTSIFTNAIFNDTFMEDVEFVNSIFTNASFNNADMQNVSFRNSINAPTGFSLLSSTLTPQNTGTDLTGTSFLGAEIFDSSFEGADFADADLSGASFRNVNLLGANVNQQQLNSLAFFSGTLPDGTIVSVPEPSMMLGLFLFGGLGLARRKN
ncbi:pentapeptide repeat-containing protein [Cyanothece sp. BG0011]|uniref:pentapeptide repeat-containing protein n=1 Tax=Cyanothece sp. BG0011 TaxID=2082950 RepID=UPI0018E55A09|nr:pentapeptide repeat-containing protein [Cyanothece sp. BG0011]